MVIDVARWLATKESEAKDPILAAEYSKLDELFTKKLWHQITVRLLELFNNPALNAKGSKALVEFYDNFVREVEMRINSLSLMELCVKIIVQMNAEEALAFLDKIEPKLKGSKEAQALCRLCKGDIQLIRQKDVQSAKITLESVDEILRSIDGISSVHGRFYLLESDLHRQLNETTKYYRSALKFLGCTDISTLSLESQQRHAEELTIAALVGDGIYNFGELLSHPILNSLRRTPKEWLIELMRAFNEGNLKQFQVLKKQWGSVPQLKKNESLLRAKIVLLSIMETTFRRSSFERELTFQEIMDATELSENEVEIYIMKAISKGLVRGRIDQVSKTVCMTWVQPRVLEIPQINIMISRLDDWKNEIQGVEAMVANNAADILL